MGKEKSNTLLATYFGCLPKISVPINKMRKFGQKTVNIVFLYYAPHSIAHKLILVKSEMHDVNAGIVFRFKDRQH